MMLDVLHFLFSLLKLDDLSVFRSWFFSLVKLGYARDVLQVSPYYQLVGCHVSIGSSL